MGTDDTITENNEKNIASDLENKIIRQVEYYFGNYNLGKDKFLRDQIKLDDGWVPMEIMTRFKRLKSLSDDFTVIIEALKKSPTQLMEANEDGTKIRRRLEKPLPENSESRKEEIDGRSIYVKGFKQDTSLDELLDFFKPHKVENITMRRRPNKVFKGSVYVTFDTKEDAETFFGLKDIKYGSTELLKEYKKDYCKRKDILYEQIKKEKELKKQKKSEKQEEEPSDIPPPEITKGCLLKLTGFGKNVKREDIKEAIDPLGPTIYVDYSKGQEEAVVRFETPIAASVLEKCPIENEIKVIEICSEKIPVLLIEGDEEVEYWKTIARFKSQARQKYRERGSQRHQWNKGRFNKKNRNKRQHHESEDADVSEETVQKKIKREHNTDDANGPVEKSKSDEVLEESPAKKMKLDSTADEANGHVEKSDSAVKVEAE